MSKDATRVTTDEYFGGCPECGGNDGHLNVFKAHYCRCDEHKTVWFVGSNQFSNWHRETEEDWRRNQDLLQGYRPVEPVYPEREEVETSPMHKLSVCVTGDVHEFVQAGGEPADAAEELRRIAKKLDTDSEFVAWLRQPTPEVPEDFDDIPF
jgi:hypothetical protein